jgi:hypothetical protein
MTVSTHHHDIARTGGTTADAAGRPGSPDLAVGTAVEVRSRFDRRWARGFAVAAATGDTYQVRRESDGTVLPAWFPRDEIRRTVTA